MRFAETDIPEALLEAQREGSLVVFAGAGVSMGGVSHYPSFVALADQIAAGVYKRERDEAIDRFLGRLEMRGVRVRDLACRLLQDPTSRPNPIHTDLTRLFAPGTNLRLVTTNFDRHFSTVLQGQDIQEYHAPALPSGNDFSGLVYLHGSVQRGPTSLVLTDGDFGATYLTEGRAARFVLAMLTQYTVLFVGYSYNDPLPFYLTRGLGRARAERHYVLTPGNRAEFWSVLGVTPVIYPQQTPQDHSAIERTVKAWADLIQMRPTEHEARIKKLLAIPDELSEDDSDYLLYAVRGTPTVWFFTQEANDPKWLNWADKKELLGPLFHPDDALYGTAGIIGQWFATKFACNHADLALALVQRHGGKIHSVLWTSLTYALTSMQSIWVAILVDQAPREQNHAGLERLLLRCNVHEDQDAIVLILEHLTTPHLRLETAVFELPGQNAVRGNIHLDCDTSRLRRTWSDHITPCLDKVVHRLVPIITAHLLKAHTLLKSVGRADAFSDPMSLYRAAVESHQQNAYGLSVNILIDWARDCLERLLKTDMEQARGVIAIWFGSECKIRSKAGSGPKLMMNARFK